MNRVGSTETLAALLLLLPLLALTVVAAKALMSCAADWLRSASLLTSVATTANPFPCSPALAASIAALSANRFV